MALDRAGPLRWDQGRIGEGHAALERARTAEASGRYQLQAAITALHSEAPDADAAPTGRRSRSCTARSRSSAHRRSSSSTGQRRSDSPSGPHAGLELLEPLLEDPALERYQPLHATHAELLRRAGDLAGAARAYERAIELSATRSSEPSSSAGCGRSAAADPHVDLDVVTRSGPLA